MGSEAGWGQAAAHRQEAGRPDTDKEMGLILSPPPPQPQNCPPPKKEGTDEQPRETTLSGETGHGETGPGAAPIYGF